jgi:hypothetical protein
MLWQVFSTNAAPLGAGIPVTGTPFGRGEQSDDNCRAIATGFCKLGNFFESIIYPSSGVPETLAGIAGIAQGQKRQRLSPINIRSGINSVL